MDLKSVNNLLDFLEKTFNGGSDFNAPVKRCLDRLTDSKWANSDILLVSGGRGVGLGAGRGGGGGNRTCLGERPVVCGGGLLKLVLECNTSREVVGGQLFAK